MADEQPVKAEIVAPPEVEWMDVKMQKVIITFANGKTGVFSGPVVVSAIEYQLNPPKMVDIVFTEPFDTRIPVPKGSQEAVNKDVPKS